MAKRLAELGALQDAVSNNEAAPSRLGLAGYIRGLFLDWSANPYNPLSRLSARGRLLGYFWDSGAIGLSMNFADQNFLIKDGTVQSKSFNQIVNFTRTTNATVTNSAGQITYAPHNLLTYSEQFDNTAWVNVGSTEAANTAIAPNGTQTADTLIDTTTTGRHSIYEANTTSALTYTFSVYAKAGTLNYIKVGLAATGTTGVYFNLATGTKGTEDAGFTGAIESVGNGWYRCSITTLLTAAVNYAQVMLSTNGSDAGSYTGLGTGTAYIWGAQLEIGSTATTYNSTTVKNLLGYSELFDNAAWTKSNSFVQTNLLTYSEAFDNAAWVNVGTTETANSVIAPNGYQTADTLIDTATTGRHSIYEAYTTSALTYTFSVYAKAGTLNYIKVGIATTGTTGVYFNLATGTKGTEDAGFTGVIENVGNGWYRCSITTLLTAAANYAQVMLSTNGSDAGSYAGLGTGTAYIWGAQLVQGSVAGDYRRTDAAALPVYYPNHNGVVCAEQLHGTAANGTILESYTATGGSMTFSLWMRRITGTGNVDITMDTGVTWTTQAITTSWARYSITTTPTAGARTAGIRLVTSSDVIQVFGGMVSDSASLDPYVVNAAAAPTAAAYYGARFDYDPVTLAPKGLLIEEQRANLFLNSSLAGTNLATQSVTVTAVPHTISFYGTGTVALTGTAIATVVGDGAYPTRKTLTFTPTAGVVLFTVTGTVQYAQLEIGSFATSFIPTAASQVTRAADVPTIQGSNFYSWINQNEGTYYVEGSALWKSPAAVRYIASLIGTTGIILYSQVTGSNVQSYDGTNILALANINWDTNKRYTSSYKASTKKLSVAGAITSGSYNNGYGVATGITLRGFDSGYIKNFRFYPTDLSNAVQQGLTA